MNDTVAAAGDMVSGTLLARAAEPVGGEHDGHSHETACLNCATPLVGSHCHACGQPAHVHKTLGASFHDLAHGVFHFEGKIWRTLPMLALRPGRLTREYIDGRRASYVSPIALFLFCVFLLFAVVKQVAPDFGQEQADNVDGKAIQGVDANRARIAELKKQRAVLVAQHQSTQKVDAEIDGREDSLGVVDQITGDVDSAVREGPEQKKYSDIAAIDKGIKTFRANPQLAAYKVQSNAYKYAWALIPISVPFIWLLFPFSRRFGLYDHTVFVTYSLCAMMLLGTILALGGVIGLPFMAAALFVLPPVHMFIQLRDAYGLRKRGALWRTAALLFVSAIALTLFALLVVAQAGSH